MWFFVLTVLLGPFVGRQIGWSLSKRLLYLLPLFLTIITCVLWGAMTAYLLRYAINRLHPGIILKIVGFGGSAYVAIPNYGLLAESTIPDGERLRHSLIGSVPLISFAIFSAALAFL